MSVSHFTSQQAGERDWRERLERETGERDFVLLFERLRFRQTLPDDSLANEANGVMMCRYIIRPL